MTRSSLHANLSQKTFGSSRAFKLLKIKDQNKTYIEFHIISINFFFDFGLGYSGYMSPEYAVKGHFSTKSDVFSFGVIVLEIISGRKNTSFTESEDSLSLLGHVSIGLHYFFL